MPKELRGSRYLTAENDRLGRLLVNDIPYWDFGRTIRFYRWLEEATDDDGRRVLDDNGRALLNANDRFYLLTVTCKRHDAWHPWLFERCREVESNPDGYLDLWARYHYKSSIGTFAGILQEIIVDPEITVAIMSGTNSVAVPFLIQLQEEMENNEDLKRIHDDVFWSEPRKQSPLWSGTAHTSNSAVSTNWFVTSGNATSGPRLNGLRRVRCAAGSRSAVARCTICWVTTSISARSNTRMRSCQASSLRSWIARCLSQSGRNRSPNGPTVPSYAISPTTS